MLRIAIGFALFVIVKDVKAQTFDDAQRLREYLLNGSRYSKDIRPVRNQSKPVEIEVSYFLSSVVHVDIARGMIETKGYLNLSWTDETMTWEPSLFGNIQSIHLPFGQIWDPEIAVFGAAEENEALTNSKFSVNTVLYDGTVYIFHLGNLKTRCQTDTTLFPFDSHTCILHLYATKYNSNEVYLRTPSQYIATGFEPTDNYEWEIVENSSKAVKIYDPSLVIYIFRFDARLVIRRRATFVILHQIIPCILILCLNLFTCFVPLNSGERLSYSVTIFLAFVFFMETVVESLPKNSLNISVSSYAFLTINGINSLTVIWSVICVRLSTLDSQSFYIPVFLQKLVLWKLGRNNRVTNETKISRETKHPGNRDGVAYNSARTNVNNPNHTTATPKGHLVCCTLEQNNRNANEASISYNTDKEIDTCFSVGPTPKKRETGSLERYKNSDRNGEPDEKISWLQVATLLDKVYFTILVLSTILLLVISLVRYQSIGGFV